MTSIEKKSTQNIEHLRYVEQWKQLGVDTEHIEKSSLFWIDAQKIPDAVLISSRKIPTIQGILSTCALDTRQQALLGVQNPTPTHTDDLRYDISIAKAWLAGEKQVDISFIQELEHRSEMDMVLHIDVAKMHVQISKDREIRARQYLCDPVIPYIFPGELTQLHIELFAGGEKSLHVLHVDHLRKIGELAVDALEMDCQHVAMWLLDILEVLPEKLLKKEIERLAKKRKLQGGGIGVLAVYASRLGMDEAPILALANQYDRLLWLVDKEIMHSIA